MKYKYPLARAHACEISAPMHSQDIFIDLSINEHLYILYKVICEADDDDDADINWACSGMFAPWFGHSEYMPPKRRKVVKIYACDLGQHMYTELNNTSRLRQCDIRQRVSRDMGRTYIIYIYIYI
jgi:hypothetical protein